MKRYFFITVIFYVAFLTFASYSVSKAYFADMAVSASNTFTASETFPTPTSSETTPTDETPTGTPSATPTTTETPTPTPPGEGSIVINEIMWMGSSASTADEWIELRNTTGTSLNISGWTIEGASATPITLSGSIPANGFYLIANFTANSVSSILNVTPEIVNASVSIPNENLQVTLRDISTNLIDRADDGSGVPFAGLNTATDDKSMERNSTPGDGTVSGSWHTALSQTNIDSGAIEFATPKSANSL
jgi:hypothetical protein